MKTFSYIIETNNESTGYYIKHLLQMHGMFYPWEVKKSSLGKKNTIRITINKISQEPFVQKKSQGRTQSSIISELFLTTDNCFLRNLGLILREQQNEDKHHWGYIISKNHNATLPVQAFSIPLYHTREIEELSYDWSVKYYLSRVNCSLSAFSATRVINGTNQSIISIDIIEFINYSMLGPKDDSYKTEKFEEWADTYELTSSPPLANVAYIDEFLDLLINMLVQMSWEAFPIRVGYYPSEKSAPLIVTGDSDDATSNQIDNYLSTLETQNIPATIIIKEYNSYKKRYLQDILSRNHAFGIHPYSETGTVKEYINNFNFLCNCLNKILCVSIYGLRNHRFQWVGRTITIELEKKAKVFFDLNCVVASGHKWLGTGSGIGFPIAFPPQNDSFSTYPLQLPTILEDDVFLFDYDYCYKPFKTGDRLTLSVVIDFLEEWIFNKKLPAVLNLHPEHVTPNTRVLLDEIVNWISNSNPWTPTLYEFANWIEDRNSTTIKVRLEDENLKISINSPVSIVVQVNNKGNHKEKSTEQYFIKRGSNFLYLKY